MLYTVFAFQLKHVILYLEYKQKIFLSYNSIVSLCASSPSHSSAYSGLSESIVFEDSVSPTYIQYP